MNSNLHSSGADLVETAIMPRAGAMPSPSAAAGPILLHAAACPPNRHLAPHAHDRTELMCIGQGSVLTTTEAGTFLIPAGSAVLFPAATVHEVRTLSDAYIYILRVSEEAGDAGLLGVDDGEGMLPIIPMSPLMQELLPALLQTAATQPTGGTARAGRIGDLILEEAGWLLRQQQDRSPAVPVPGDHRLLRACRAVLRELDRAWTIGDAAEAAGMSRRNFTRAFRQEAGTTFGAWCLQARLTSALRRLRDGATITDVALESGYSNPGAFATAFKRSLGISPSQYQPASVAH